MNLCQVELDHSRLQAPRDDRAALIEPPLENVAAAVAENLRNQGQLHEYDLHGRSLAEISLLARSELIDAARRWTSAYRNVTQDGAEGDSPIFVDHGCAAVPAKNGTVPDASDVIYLAGHQPQMFHPGVWFKNFVLGELARRDGATAINVIIDGDTFSEAALRVPGGSAAQPRTAQIPFDALAPTIPYAERKIVDRDLFASFGQRATEQMTGLVREPLLTQYWPLVQSQARHCDNLGACLAQARHQLEGQWGLDTLEVPQSWACKGEAFHWFVAHLLARLPDFRTAYNESLGEYRERHRLRSRLHPAPDLAEEGPWLEAPLWIWTADSPLRRRLFVRAAAEEIVLSDRQSWQARLPLRADGDAARAVERLMELQRAEVRIRPRALLTTLWARLALGDLFIHGIGGAKYDCVTNRLIERFFGLAPPRFAVVSATLHLPIGRQAVSIADVRALQQELRETTYQPERYLTNVAQDIEDQIDEKRRWIATPQTAENARQRCRAIRRVNAALQPLLADRRQRLAARLAETSQRLHAEKILAWREYAFCLYPETALREFVSALLPTTT